MLNVQIKMIWLVCCWCWCLLTTSAPLLDASIVHDIFHSDNIYMLYVSEETDLTMQALLNQYCQGDRYCALLNKSVEMYESLRDFIGAREEAYFAILDPQRSRKFVLPIHPDFMLNDLLIFQSNFQQGLLMPFLASEEPPTDIYEPCRKVVGLTLDDFLSLPTDVKVLFLYTENPSCEICGEMLRIYADLAQNLYQPELVVFGYFDLLKNDHNTIKDEIMPYFLLWKGDKQPVGLDAENMEELFQLVVDMVTEGVDIEGMRQQFEQKGIDPSKLNEHQFSIDENPEQYLQRVKSSQDMEFQSHPKQVKVIDDDEL